MVSRIQTQRRKIRSPASTTTRKHFSVTAVVVDIVCQFGVSGIYSVCPRKFITKLRSQKQKKFKLNRLHRSKNTQPDNNVGDVTIKVLVESVLRELNDGGYLNTSKKRVRYKPLPHVKEITPLHLLSNTSSEWTPHVKRNRSSKSLRKDEDRQLLTDISSSSVLPTLVVTNSNSVYQLPHLWTRSGSKNENIPSSSGTESADQEPVKFLHNYDRKSKTNEREKYFTDHEDFSSEGSKLSLYEHRVPEGCDANDLPHDENSYSFSPSQSSVRRRRNAQSVVSSISCYLDDITGMEFGSSVDLYSSNLDNDEIPADDEEDILVSRTFSSRFYSVPAYTADTNLDLELDDKRGYKLFSPEKPHSSANYSDNGVSSLSLTPTSSSEVYKETFCSDASLYLPNLSHQSSDRRTMENDTHPEHEPVRFLTNGKSSFSTAQTDIECRSTFEENISKPTMTVFDKVWNKKLVSQIQDSKGFSVENDSSNSLPSLFPSLSAERLEEKMSGKNSDRPGASQTSPASSLSSYTDNVKHSYDITNPMELQDNTSQLSCNTKSFKTMPVSFSLRSSEEGDAEHHSVHTECPLSDEKTIVGVDSKKPDASQLVKTANGINCSSKPDLDTRPTSPLPPNSKNGISIPDKKIKISQETKSNDTDSKPQFSKMFEKIAEFNTKRIIQENIPMNNASRKDVVKNAFNTSIDAKKEVSGNDTMLPASGGSSSNSIDTKTLNNSLLNNFTEDKHEHVNGIKSPNSKEIVDMSNVCERSVHRASNAITVQEENNQTSSQSSTEPAQQISFLLSLDTENTNTTQESKHQDSDPLIKLEKPGDRIIESDSTPHPNFGRRHTIVNTECRISDSATEKKNMTECRRKSWGGHTLPKIVHTTTSPKNPKLVTPTTPEIKASGFKLSLNEYSRSNSMEDGVVPIPEVKPGFFHLNVVVMSDRGRLHLNESISLLQSRCASEHEIVSNAIQNLICVFMCQDRSRRLEARKQLYNLSKSNPENLNTLANLEYIYRASHRATDAKACRAKINDLMEKKGRKCDVLKAQCLLEQAYIYALLYNDHTGYEIVQERVQDISTRLDGLQRFCNSAETKLAVEIAHEHVQQMTRDVLNVEENIQCKSFEKDFCLKNYLGGMELLSSQPGTENDVIIWSYYQAVANYLLSDLGSESAKTNDSGPFRNKAAHLFLKVFKHLDPELKLYRARSLSYLGHLLSTAFEGKGDVFKDTLETFKITVTQQGGVPLFLFDKAKSFCNDVDDHVVLTTEARHYMGKALYKSNDTKEKKRSLDRADQAITRAIKALEDQQMNWYAYKHKRDINFSIYQLSLSQNETYLRQAKKAGEACILSGGVDDLVYLGMICNALATCQTNSRKQDTVADREDILYEGVDYLQQAIERGVQSKMKIQCYASLANSLFQLKQHRYAIECLKRVIEDDVEKDLELFKQLCVFFFQNYKQAGKDGVFILQELLFWIDWCGRKYGEDDVIGILAKHTKEYFNEILDLLELIADKITKNGLSSSHSMLTKMKTKLEKIKQNESKKRLPKPSSKSLFGSPRFGRKKTEKEIGGCVNNLIKSSIHIPVMIPQSYGSYDFYVFNSPVDGEWVMHVLRPALEESFGTEPLRGYLAGRDFAATDCGRIGPLKFAFARNLKIIIVLSEDFIANEWFRYERKEQDAIRLLEEKASEGCIVPISLDSKLEVDEEITKVTGETLVKPTDWDTIRRCLVCV